MRNVETPLWVIEFDKPKPGDLKRPDCHLSVPENSRERLKKLAEEGSWDSFEELFMALFNASFENGALSEDLKRDLDELAETLDEFQKWIEKIADDLENPSQDP